MRAGKGVGKEGKGKTDWFATRWFIKLFIWPFKGVKRGLRPFEKGSKGYFLEVWCAKLSGN